MSLSGLRDAECTPGPEALRALLGSSADRWYCLIDAISEYHPPVTEVWNHGGDKIGWTLRLKRGDRVIVYLIPQAGGFLAGLVLGERAVEATHSLALPEPVRSLVESAPRYAEGRGLRVPVCSDDDLAAVIGLVAAKMAPGRRGDT